MSKPFFENLYSIIKSSTEKREDYLTELLKLYLSEYDNSALFFKYLINDHKNDFNEKFKYYTQIKYKSLSDFNDSRLDLLARSDSYIIYIENKWDAKLGYQQLEKYVEALKLEYQKNKFLLFITKEKENYELSNVIHICEKFKINFYHFTWGKVYLVLKNIFEDESTKDYKSILLEELIKYLEYYNMQRIENLEQNDLELLKKAKRINLIEDSILTEITNIKLKDLGFDLPNDDWIDINNLSGNEFWGKKINIYEGLTLFIYFKLIKKPSNDYSVYLALMFQYWGTNEEIREKFFKIKNSSWKFNDDWDLISEEDIMKIMSKDKVYPLILISKHIIDTILKIKNDINLILDSVKP